MDEELGMAAVGPTPAKHSTYWSILVAVGLVASAAGLIAPQWIPADKAMPRTTSRASDDLAYTPPTWPER